MSLRPKSASMKTAASTARFCIRDCQAWMVSLHVLRHSTQKRLQPLRRDVPVESHTRGKFGHARVFNGYLICLRGGPGQTTQTKSS
jgi:hypothetical protein